MKDYRLMKNRGITLIALVVTIIVLLILAGISISMLTGQNGILNRASEAKEKTETANIDEQRKLAQAEALMNTDKTTYKGLTLPEGFAPTKIDGEDSIDDGLVITDGYGNEYVWVEVPKTTEVYPTAGLNITNFTDEEYTKIEKDLHTYTNEYRKGTSYSDTWYDAKNDPKEANKSDWYQSESEYNTAKQKMLKSVYQNGGFWVGRYEAGIEANRTASGIATITPLSKQNMYPYNYVTRTQAKKLAEQVESGSCTSSLMFGVQWDLVLKYIETKDKTQKYNLITDSTNIGNYYKSAFELNRGKFAQYGALSNWFDYNSVEKADLVTECKKKTQNSYENGILLTTGATDVTKLKNIYDIAGNEWEWTLEKTSNSESPCTVRGGSYDNNALNNPVSARESLVVSGSYGGVGFRVSLY